MRINIRRRVRELMADGIYDQLELYTLIQPEFRTHYSVIREEIHRTKNDMQAAEAALT